MSEQSKFYDRRRPAHQPVVDGANASRIFFLTVCTENRKPILCTDAVHQLLRDTWRKADTWLIGRYILMPDHIHLFCSPVGLNYPSLTQWISYWKSLAARVWPDQDVGKLWQRDFWDTQLRRGESYTEKWHYVVNNPVRAGLLEDSSCWPYQGEICELQWHD